MRSSLSGAAFYERTKIENLYFVTKLKKEVAIWNINSYGEFFMQIIEKYKKDYKQALVRHGVVREKFVEQINRISWLRAVPTQANYIMCELLDSRKSCDVCAALLDRDRLLVKDLTSKIGNGRQYIRVAVRREEENNELIEAFRSLCNS